ncbi:enoyl-CoA hydratase-related protein [Amycolatopsis sp. NPDC021455]|uniref:enoyl-CoA hydratase/isomerase family protein n=1 Tax=Amycolatopsis sp. NPDC021455 TaxID=3154901 RepID=UPI0033D30D9F
MSELPPPVVLVEDQGPVRVVTINRQHASNALNREVLCGLKSAVVAAPGAGARAVVLTGAGRKAFCAGADLKELAGLGPDDAYALLADGQATLRAIERSAVPVIAAVNGLALGGGFELVLASTFCVLADHATLGLPEAGLGLIPGYGGTQRLPRLIGRAAAAHVMVTGARIDAARAFAWGLTPVEPVAGDPCEAALHLAREVATKGPQAVRAILTALDLGEDAAIDTGLAMETGLAAVATSGPEGAEGLAAFLAKRAPAFAARGDG